jgi:Ser/Thr protein kinase RdoA (MazF antagonist)
MADKISSRDNPERPEQVDDASVATVMGGYRRFRKLLAAELDALPVAIRFGAAFRTTIRCHMAREIGWGGSIRRGLLHEEARIAISDEIASRAQAILTSC